MRRSLLKGSKILPDVIPNILIKSYSPYNQLNGLTLKGTDVIIKEEVSGAILWSCVGEGELTYWDTLPTLSGPDIDIRITGAKFSKISFSNSIREVKHFRINRACDLQDCFANAGYLTSVSDFLIDNVYNLTRLFSNCQELSYIEPFSIKSGAKLREAFYNCSLMTVCPVLNIEVSSDLASCFFGSGLNVLTNIAGKSLKTNFTTSMFSLCKLTSISNLIFENATEVHLSGMNFLETIDNIVASKATQIFLINNTVLTSVSNVTASLATKVSFMNCNSLTNISNFTIHPVGLTDGTSMYSGCASLVSVPPFNYTNITMAGGMFANCLSLVDLTNLQINNLQQIDSMFRTCRLLTSIPPLNYTSVTSASDCFSGCIGLTGNVTLSLGNVTFVNGLFEFCTGITSADVSINTSNTIYMSNAFNECTALTTATITVSSATNLTLTLDRAFFNCTELLTANLPTNTAVGYYYSTFENCVKLTGIPNGLVNIGDFRRTFYNCKAITSVSNRVFNSVLYSSYQIPLVFFGQTFAESGVTTAENLTFRGGVLPNGYATGVFFIGNIFENCVNLVTVSNLKIIVTGSHPHIYTVRPFFTGCPNLTSPIPIQIEQEPDSTNRTLRTQSSLVYEGMTVYNDDFSIVPYNSIVEFETLPSLTNVTLTLNCTPKDGKVEIGGFSDCPLLESIVINNPNNYALTIATLSNGSYSYNANFLQNLPNLTNLVVPNIKMSFTVPDSVVSVPVLENIINGLADNTDAAYPLQIYIGTTRKALISQAVLDGAIAKNWSVE